MRSAAYDVGRHPDLPGVGSASMRTSARGLQVATSHRGPALRGAAVDQVAGAGKHHRAAENPGPDGGPEEQDSEAQEMETEDREADVPAILEGGDGRYNLRLNLLRLQGRALRAAQELREVEQVRHSDGKDRGEHHRSQATRRASVSFTRRSGT